MSECIRGSYDDALYKSTYTLLYKSNNAACRQFYGPQISSRIWHCYINGLQFLAFVTLNKTNQTVSVIDQFSTICLQTSRLNA